MKQQSGNNNTGQVKKKLKHILKGCKKRTAFKTVLFKTNTGNIKSPGITVNN
jgi:hypothetical protein